MTPLDLMKRFGTEAISSELAGFSLRDQLFPHRRFSEATARIAELHHYGCRNKVSVGLSVSGPSGVGKTTILEHYQAQFPRYSDGNTTCIPVLTVGTPAGPTVKSLAQSILTALGDPGAHRGSAEEKTQRIYLFLERCRVQVIFLDEFHHFFFAETTRHFRQISDWLKGLMNTARVGLVLVGLPEGEEVVKANPQLWRRFSSRVLLSPFDIDDEQDLAEFRGLLRAFEAALPLPVEVPLHEANLARQFYFASDGRLDYVRKVLEGAISIANQAGLSCLDLPIYESSFRKHVWSEASDRLNPFHPASIQRRLNRAGEPFAAAGYASMIGSPVARRLGLAHHNKGEIRA